MKGTFKKDLNGNMEQSFSLDGETHQYQPDSSWWQHTEEEQNPLENPEGWEDSDTDRVGTFVSDSS